MSIPTFATYLHLSNWDARVAKVAQEMSCSRETAQDILRRRIAAQKKHERQQKSQSEKQDRLAQYQKAQQRMLGELED